MDMSAREINVNPQKSERPPKQRKFRLKNFIKTPKGYALLLLLILTLLSLTDIRNLPGIPNLFAAVVTATVVDLLAAVIQKRRPAFSDGALITGLIVALILSTNTPWIVVTATTAIASVSKHVLKIKRKPIFNPAAFGLLCATFLFSSGQSWWGAMTMSPVWSIIFLLVIGFLVTKRVNKFPQVFVFLGIYFLAFLLMGIFHVGSPGDPLRTPFINSALFLAFFMLTDPPTSPGVYKEQVIFAAIASVVSVLYYIDFGGLAYLFVGLLAANAWKAWWSWHNQPVVRKGNSSTRMGRRMNGVKG